MLRESLINGRTIKYSVASKLTLVSGYFSKDLGNWDSTSSRDGYRSEVPLKNLGSRYTCVVTVLQMVESGTPKVLVQQSQTQSIHNTIAYSSFTVSYHCLLGFRSHASP